MNLMQKMMFNVHESRLGFDETVTALTAAARESGWDIPMTYDLQKGYREAGYEDMTQATILYFCHPSGGYRILQEDDNKPMSVMMPMGVSVYETKEGQVYIAGMNLERMSMMFDGVVKEVLREGAHKYSRALADIATPRADSEVKVDGKKAALGCASFTAVVVALFGLVMALMFRLFRAVMPKMMATMMPQMMEMMEEAGVQPPCAQIILERLDAQEAGAGAVT